MKEKVNTPVIIAAVVVLAVIVGFVGWKVLGPKGSGAATSTSADYQKKMGEMNQQQMQQRGNAERFRGGGTGAGMGGPGGPPGAPGGPMGGPPGGPPGPGGQ